MFFFTSSTTGRERSKNISVTTDTCRKKAVTAVRRTPPGKPLFVFFRLHCLPFCTADTLWCWSSPRQKLGRQSFLEARFSRILKNKVCIYVFPGQKGKKRL